MSAARRIRTLEPGDLLLRKVQPGQWTGDRLHVEAFDDGKQNLSFFLNRVMNPWEVLAFFSRFDRVKEWCGTGGREPTSEEMYDAGYRIAVLRIETVAARGCRFKTDERGNEF